MLEEWQKNPFAYKESDKVYFPIKNNERPENNNAEAQLLPGLLAWLPVRSKANQLAHSSLLCLK